MHDSECGRGSGIADSMFEDISYNEKGLRSTKGYVDRARLFAKSGIDRSKKVSINHSMGNGFGCLKTADAVPPEHGRVFIEDIDRI